MKPSAIPGSRRREGAGPGRFQRGVTLVELLVVIVILGALLAVGVPTVAKMLRRMECASALSGVTRVLTTARLAAIKGVSGATVGTPPAPVVVLITAGGPGDQQMRLRSFVDLDQDFAPTPDEATQRYLDDVVFPDGFFFEKAGGTRGELTSSVLFSAFRQAPSPGTEMINRIVFLPNGGLVPSQATGKGRPDATAGRGIYFADRRSLNFFRVTIYSDSVARPVAEKWVDATTGYSSAGWSWK